MTAWDISTASYTSVSFSVAGQTTTQYNVAFKPDGTVMYVPGAATSTVFQYALSSPFDLSTASYGSVSFSTATESSTPTGLYFKTDGTKMYVLGTSNDTVYQYTLATPWNVSTASYDSVSKSVNAQDSAPTGMTMKTDGSKMYIVGSTNKAVYQYTLSSPWDLSTASYDTVSFSISSQDSFPCAIKFRTDNGESMYVMGNTTDTVYQYALGTGWDLSTASYGGKSFSVTSQENSPTGVAFNDVGSKMYAIGFTGDTVYQYSLAGVTSNSNFFLFMGA